MGSQEAQVGSDAEELLTCGWLGAILEAEGYQSSSYSFGRHAKFRDQAFILDRWSNRWVVYYTERGPKTDIRKHVSEDTACRDLLTRLRGDSGAVTASAIEWRRHTIRGGWGHRRLITASSRTFIRRHRDSELRACVTVPKSHGVNNPGEFVIAIRSDGKRSEKVLP